MFVLRKLVVFIVLSFSILKVYAIDPEDDCLGSSLLISHIITNDEGVSLKIGSEWITTDGLQASEMGMYVLVQDDWMPIEEAVENPKCLRSTWECPKCHFINYDGIKACAVCSRPRYG